MCLAHQEGGELGPVLPPDDREGEGVDHQATDDPAPDGKPLPGGLLLPGGDDLCLVTCSTTRWERPTFCLGILFYYQVGRPIAVDGVNATIHDPLQPILWV